jgi:hypothetical protein
MLPYREGGGLPVVGVGCSLMTHSAGSVTTQKKAFKYVMPSEPYRYTWYFKHVMVSLPYIKTYFFETLTALKLKSLWVWLKFSLIHNKFLGRYAKNWIFYQNNNLQDFFFKVIAWLFNHAVCKIVLMKKVLGRNQQKLCLPWGHRREQQQVTTVTVLLSYWLSNSN